MKETIAYQGRTMWRMVSQNKSIDLESVEEVVNMKIERSSSPSKAGSDGEKVSQSN